MAMDDEDMLYREMDPDDDFYMDIKDSGDCEDYGNSNFANRQITNQEQSDRCKKTIQKTGEPTNKEGMIGCLVIFALGFIGTLLYMWLFND